MDATDVYKMKTNDTFIYIFQVKLKTKAAKSFVKNIYKSLSK